MEREYLNTPSHPVVSDMYETLFQEIGLTENEAKVYIALLKIGNSTSSKIISEAKVSGGKIYETLDKLYQRGFVSISNINGVKHFQATNPEAIINYIGEQKDALVKKEEKFIEILPQLKSIQESPIFSSETLIGTRAIKSLVEELFSSAKEPIMAMGLRGDKEERYNNFWWHITKEQIEAKKKKAKYLFVENKSGYYKKLSKLKHLQVKSLKSVSPAAIDIIDNHVLILTYEEDELHCVHIYNTPIAKSFKAFFENLWKQAK